MAFLVIAGTAYQVQTQSATQNASVVPGEQVRAFNNALLVTLDPTTKKRQWQFTLAPMTQAASDALVAAAEAKVVPVSGDALSGASVNALVTMPSNAYLPDGLGFLRVPTVLLDEA